MKSRVHKYKGFVIKEVKEKIDGQETVKFEIYSNEEWEMGQGYRSPEWDTGSLQEAKEFIDDYKKEE
jgi:hypothetical protein